MTQNAPAAKVYYDGSCALCRAEIAHYQRQDGAQTLCFLDVSACGDAIEPDLTRAQAMARFHVRDASGQLASGAAAFVSVWRALPRWRWAARLATLPGMMIALEKGYRLFLPVRPWLARLMRASQARAPGK